MIGIDCNRFRIDRNDFYCFQIKSQISTVLLAMDDRQKTPKFIERKETRLLINNVTV